MLGRSNLRRLPNTKKSEIDELDKIEKALVLRKQSVIQMEKALVLRKQSVIDGKRL